MTCGVWMAPNDPMPGGNRSDLSICCAYDGSVNAHWVARYAIRCASATSSRSLRLIHARDRHISEGLMERKLAHMLAECENAGIDARIHDVRTGGNVAEAVLEAVPAIAGTVLVCGTRARARRQRLLAGTVSEALLRQAPCSVLALRVVLPGLLGAPRRVLIPVAGNPGEGRSAAAIVELLLSGLDELHLLRVVVTDATSARFAPRNTAARLRDQGRAAVTHVENELRQALALGDVHVDSYVRVAEDWVRPSLITAGQHKCGLILAGASERLLSGAVDEARLTERLLADTPCDVGIFRGAP